jgi:hypothetical protein
MTAPLHTSPSLETLACNALAQSRRVLPDLRGIIAEWMFGDARFQALAIADSIARRDIFQACVSWDLHDLIRQIDAEIEGMIVQVTMWSDHDCDVTGNTWVETLWTQEATDLASARIKLTALCEAIDAVIDHRELPQILACRRQIVTPARST